MRPHSFTARQRGRSASARTLWPKFIVDGIEGRACKDAVAEAETPWVYIRRRCSQTVLVHIGDWVRRARYATHYLPTLRTPLTHQSPA